jgi:ribosomal protein L30E
LGAGISQKGEAYKDYLIGKDGEYKCAKCKKQTLIWIPTDADINKKAMMTYYKCCSKCRLYLYNREAERKLIKRIEEAEREAEWAA